MTEEFHVEMKNRRARRRAEAEIRQKKRNARTDLEQLRKLEREGFGECREAKALKEKVFKTE